MQKGDQEDYLDHVEARAQDPYSQWRAQPSICGDLGKYTSPWIKDWSGARELRLTSSQGIGLSIPFTFSPAETFLSKPEKHYCFSLPGKHLQTFLDLLKPDSASPLPHPTSLAGCTQI